MTVTVINTSTVRDIIGLQQRLHFHICNCGHFSQNL